MIQTMKLERIILNNEELEYIEVPFHMPSGIKKILVSFETEIIGEGDCVIDLGIKDSFSVRGWSGGARREFYIGKKHATPGYKSGFLYVGEWAVLLGAYRVPKDGCKIIISLCLEYEVSENYWLKGDLHLHSVHSDGSYTIEENAKIAQESGLDFIALTDHNTISQNYLYDSYENVLFIPGMELTTYKGHCNLLGSKNPIKDFRASTVNEMKEKIKEARQNNCSISLNHPFDESCSWEYGFNVDYDWIEIWNGPWREGNERALEWWQSMLLKGEKMVVIGGSDSHRPHPYVRLGMPTTWVNCKSKSVNHILDAISKGHVYLTYSPLGPEMEFTCGDGIIGDTVTNEEKMELVIEKLQANDIVKIISDKGIEKEYQIKNERMIHKIWEIVDRTFYRIEVWRYFLEVDGHLMALLSNPIYTK